MKRASSYSLYRSPAGQLVFSFIVIALITVLSFSKSIQATEKAIPFHPGERLTFEASWSFIPVRRILVFWTRTRITDSLPGQPCSIRRSPFISGTLPRPPAILPGMSTLATARSSLLYLLTRIRLQQVNIWRPVARASRTTSIS